MSFYFLLINSVTISIGQENQNSSHHRSYSHHHHITNTHYKRAYHTHSHTLTHTHHQHPLQTRIPHTLTHSPEYKQHILQTNNYPLPNSLVQGSGRVSISRSSSNINSNTTLTFSSGKCQLYHSFTLMEKVFKSLSIW